MGTKNERRCLVARRRQTSTASVSQPLPLFTPSLLLSLSFSCLFSHLSLSLSLSLLCTDWHYCHPPLRVHTRSTMATMSGNLEDRTSPPPVRLSSSLLFIFVRVASSERYGRIRVESGSKTDGERTERAREGERERGCGEGCPMIRACGCVPSFFPFFSALSPLPLPLGLCGAAEQREIHLRCRRAAVIAEKGRAGDEKPHTSRGKQTREKNGRGKIRAKDPSRDEDAIASPPPLSLSLALCHCVSLRLGQRRRCLCWRPQCDRGRERKRERARLTEVSSFAPFPIPFLSFPLFSLSLSLFRLLFLHPLSPSPSSRFTAPPSALLSAAALTLALRGHLDFVSPLFASLRLALPARCGSPLSRHFSTIAAV